MDIPMPSENVTNQNRSILSIFSAKSLTKKASLNAAASGLDYFAALVVGLLTTPLIVTGLGDYYYGVWQVMNRMYSYLSTMGGTTSPLEWTIAKDQTSEDYDQKRSFVGSAIIIWVLLLPLILVGGLIITWFAPTWLHTPAPNIHVVRTVALLFMVSQAIISLAFLPASILRGQNQGYRRLGLSLILAAANGLLIWLAIKIGTGIIGLSVVSIIYLFLYAAFYIIMCRKFIPWFGVKRPTNELVKHFLKLSVWFFVNDIVTNITIASDVIILGLLSSVESVTTYTLTKYVPETLISLIAILVLGIIPGLGGILGSGDLKKASQLRSEIFSLTWLIVTVTSACILLWNRTFISLWVGSNRYAGPLANVLIVIVVVQYVVLRVDNSIIDLTLKIEKKVILGAISAVTSIAIACILVGVFKMGIIGICIGLILGRSILTFAYPILSSRYLKISFVDQLKHILRPVATMAALFAISVLVVQINKPLAVTGIKGWLILLVGAVVSVVVFLAAAFYIGLNSNQRTSLKVRVLSLISR
jgi:O-antigen/teichoic acid export membrane protein